VQANRLFGQAQAAYERGDKIGAYEAYKAAWALQRSYDIAGNLGGLELKLGKHRDAAEHFAFALEDFPPTGDPAQRKAVEKKLAEALQEVGRLHVQVSVPGAKVTVNGATVGTSPVPGTLYVDAGAIVIEASLPGYVSARQTLTVAKGAEASVSLSVVPERRSPDLAIVVSGSALTAVALGTGIGLFVGANNKKNDTATTLATVVSLGGCPGAAPAQCADLRNTLSSASAMHNAAVGTFVGAGVVGVATVTYALISRRPRANERVGAQVRITPTFGTTGGGLLVGGTF
jgi:tetratricopeptide (TPR) repeat protein